jgi:hypothetical protein
MTSPRYLYNRQICNIHHFGTTEFAGAGSSAGPKTSGAGRLISSETFAVQVSLIFGGD